ncbi:MAG: hypothetical protein WBG50_02135 [Desulfomonilaceae bacterium]
MPRSGLCRLLPEAAHPLGKDRVDLLGAYRIGPQFPLTVSERMVVPLAARRRAKCVAMLVQ